MRKTKNQLLIDVALPKLKLLREKHKKLKQEIEALRETIFEAGGDPDEPRVDVLPRNKQIFRAWKDGRSVKVLAKEYKLSDQSIRAICRRIDKILETKKFRFEEYKDLLP